MTGPTGKNLKLIKQYQPYGLAGIITCNKANQFICVCGKAIFKLVVFDVDCNIISVTEFGILHNLSFAGGILMLVITASFAKAIPLYHILQLMLK